MEQEAFVNAPGVEVVVLNGHFWQREELNQKVPMGQREQGCCPVVELNEPAGQGPVGRAPMKKGRLLTYLLEGTDGAAVTKM